MTGRMGFAGEAEQGLAGKTEQGGQQKAGSF